MKTYSAKPLEVERKWYVIDAEGEILGRLAVRIANILRGKNKPEYTPNVDTGDFVIVINAEKVVVSGNKETDKIYYHHTGYPGGLKAASVKEVREKDATKLIEKAVKGMLQHNTLGAEQFNKFYNCNSALSAACSHYFFRFSHYLDSFPNTTGF